MRRKKLAFMQLLIVNLNYYKCKVLVLKTGWLKSNKNKPLIAFISSCDRPASRKLYLQKTFDVWCLNSNCDKRFYIRKFFGLKSGLHLLKNIQTKNDFLLL